MVAFVIALIFVFIWYKPLFKKMGGSLVPKKSFVIAFFLGLLPAPLLASVFQLALVYVSKKLGASDLTSSLLVDIFGAGMFEELLKFLAACIVLKKLSGLRKADYMVLFGIVGIGFEFAESIMGTDDVVVSIVRGVFNLHLFFQMYLGMKAYDNEQKAGKRECYKYIWITMLLHGAYDASLDLLKDGILNMDVYPDGKLALFWGLGIVFLIASLVFVIITCKNTRKLAKETLEGKMS